MSIRLTADGKLSNLKRAFDVYIDTKLGAPGALFEGRIDWEGALFQDAGLAEWIQPRMLGPARPLSRVYRGVDVDGTRGQGLIVLLQVNIFVRPALQTLAHRVHDLRDAVLDVLHEHVKIPVVDYAGSKSTLGNLIVRRMVTDAETSAFAPTATIYSDPNVAKEDYRQWTVAGEADWIELYQS